MRVLLVCGSNIKIFQLQKLLRKLGNQISMIIIASQLTESSDPFSNQPHSTEFLMPRTMLSFSITIR